MVGGSRSPWFRAIVGLTAVALCQAADDHDHEHDHTGLWEWGGAFDLEAGEKYSWTMVRSGGSYADPHMKMVVVPAAESGEEAIHSTEETAHSLWEGTALELESGGTMSPPAGGRAYVLETDADSWITIFHIAVPTTGSYVFFAQHVPMEFETEFHFLKDEHGDDVEPTAAETVGGHDGHGHGDHGHEDEHDDEKKWGLALGASALTCTPTISCVILTALGYLFVTRVLSKNIDQDAIDRLIFLVSSGVYAFASGAIFACAVFLLLPEALHMAGAGEDEVTGTWTWGTSILLGWLACLLIRHVSDILWPVEEDEPAEKGEAKTGRKLNLGTAIPVFVGDFLHNFADGMVISIAAKSCSTSMVWTIAASTVAHEAPQELADYLILVTKGGMHWFPAMVGNVTSSLSTVLGAIIVTATDISENWQGRILAFSAGVYLYVAITDLARQITETAYKPGESRTRGAVSSIVRFAAFAFAATAIGLVLLKHEHCGHDHGAEGGDDHSGHGH